MTEPKMKEATPKRMQCVGHGTRHEDGAYGGIVSFLRDVQAHELCPGRWLVQVFDAVSFRPSSPSLLALPPEPGNTYTVVVEANSIEELRGMFFEDSE